MNEDKNPSSDMKRYDVVPRTRILIQRDVRDEDTEEGDVVELDEACVSPLDRGFLYGDAVFETLRCYDSEPAFLEKHVERLNESLDELDIPTSFTTRGIERRVERLVSSLFDGTGDDAYVRICVTRGQRSGRLTPTEMSPTLVGIAESLDTRKYEPATVETVEGEDVTRPLGALGRLKTHNYLPNILAKSEVDRDVDEALMFDSSGGVASGATSNVFFFVNDVLVTPEKNIRKGVTREVVLGIAGEVGIETREGHVKSLENVDSGFLTNSSWGVREIRSLDGRELESDERIQKIAEEYFSRVVP